MSGYESIGFNPPPLPHPTTTHKKLEKKKIEKNETVWIYHNALSMLV